MIFQSDKLFCSTLRHMIHPIAWLRLKIRMLQFAFFPQCKLNATSWVLQRRLKKSMLIDGKNCACYIFQDLLYRFILFFLFYFLSKLRSPSIQVCSDQREGCRISLDFFFIHPLLEVVQYWKNVTKAQTLGWLLIPCYQWTCSP